MLVLQKSKQMERERNTASMFRTVVPHTFSGGKSSRAGFYIAQAPKVFSQNSLLTRKAML